MVQQKVPQDNGCSSIRSAIAPGGSGSAARGKGEKECIDNVASNHRRIQYWSGKEGLGLGRR